MNDDTGQHSDGQGVVRSRQNQTENPMILSYKGLYELEEEDLSKYLSFRLRSLPTNPPIAYSRDEDPEDIIIKAMKSTADQNFKKRMEKHIYRLLNAEWLKCLLEDTYDCAYLSRLLFLIQRFEFFVARPVIFDMASNSKRLAGKFAFYGVDLYDQALSTLSYLQEGPPGYVERWEAILKSDKMRAYWLTAFTGWSLCGFQEGLQAMNMLIKRLESDDNIPLLKSALQYFYMQYHQLGYEIVSQALADEIAELPVELEHKLRFFQAIIGIPLLRKNHAKKIFDIIFRPVIRDQTKSVPMKAFRRGKEILSDLVKNHKTMQKLRDGVLAIV